MGKLKRRIGILLSEKVLTSLWLRKPDSLKSKNVNLF